MIIGLTKRLLAETDPRLLLKFAYGFGWKGMRAVQRFEKRRKRGDQFPAFIVMSVTDSCNLRCQGCWVTQMEPARELSLEQMESVVLACKKNGSYFFGILGGEPLLHPQVFELMERHPDCYFQIFTNGLLLTEEVAARMRKLGNVTPLISIEGNETISDQRRGGDEVYERTIAGLDACRRNRLIVGVATSVCRSNINDLVTRDFLDEMVNRGAHYLWYYVYRPVGEDPCPDLALTEEQILHLRRFIVDQRARVPLIIVDAYWDHEGNALCPAAIGISHHIGPSGDVEFCPPIQFAAESVLGSANVADLISSSEFLKRFRAFSSGITRGCILLEEPGLLRKFLEKENAHDTSGRGTLLEELAAMRNCPGHHIPGREIPDKHWAYRFAKKRWFFGFGAYG